MSLIEQVGIIGLGLILLQLGWMALEATIQGVMAWCDRRERRRR